MYEQQRDFQIHAATWAAINGFLFLIWILTTPGGFPWFLFPAGAMGIPLAIHAVATFGHPGGDDPELEAGDPSKALPHGEDPSDYRTLGR
ncbi:MAG: 2TM domain-containing protein [Acidimicrobiales bacterium]